MRKNKSFFNQYWLEILIVITLLLFPIGWGWLKQVLYKYGLLLPTGFYLSCEVIYDTAAILAVYYTGFLQGLIKKIKDGSKTVTLLELPFWWLRSIRIFIRDIKHHLINLDFILEKVKFWFGINRVFALIQPGVTLVLVVVKTSLPWFVLIPVIVFLLADLISTIVIIVAISRKLKGKGKINIRLATEADLTGILIVDKERYGEVDSSVTATSEMMKQRIKVSNEQGTGWFWIAEQDGKIIGLLSLQPTMKAVDNFISWEDSTANGTLTSTFQEDGENLYVVALTCTQSAPDKTVDLLLIRAACKWIEAKKRCAFFCGRMPYYYKHKEQITAEEYFQAKDNAGEPLDPQIKLYTDMGFSARKLVPNAFKGDWQSGGYGVLFVADNPLYSWPFPKFLAFIFSIIAKNRKAFSYLLKL